MNDFVNATTCSGVEQKRETVKELLGNMDGILRDIEKEVALISNAVYRGEKIADGLLRVTEKRSALPAERDGFEIGGGRMTDSYHMGFKDGQQSLIDQGYEKVKHGRWVDNTPTTDEYGNPLSMVADPSKYIDLTCSMCGRKATIKADYCPNCGALMVNEDECD